MLPEDVIGKTPEWVLWIARDQDGAWWGFEIEPNEGADSWYENEVGRYVRLGAGSSNPDWRQSLHRHSSRSSRIQ